MKCLLDTHFLLWVALGAERLQDFPWLDRLRPWGVSPVSFLEVAFLGEVGRLSVEPEAFTERVRSDRRFVVDEVALLPLVAKALDQQWIRDPFDRLLVAHSLARRIPLCTVDREIRRNHPLTVREVGA